MKGEKKRREIGYLEHTDIATALDVQKARGERVTVHVLEASGDTALQIAQGLEERHELVRLATLHLAVLDGGAAQRHVELDRLVCSNALLVLARVLAQPEVDVPLQSITTKLT